MRDEYDWAGKPSTNSAEVMRQYDEFAPGYDETLLGKWGYDAPARAAELLANHTALDAGVLDAGCGTGLTGLQLKRCGFDALHGVDISSASLQLAARKGVYRSLTRADLLEPLPFSSDTFDAIVCVGVLSYLSGDAPFREFCRVARPGGIIVLSHRSDLVVARGFGDLLHTLANEGLWSPVSETAPVPYLPGHPDFGEKIPVQYFVLGVRCGLAWAAMSSSADASAAH